MRRGLLLALITLTSTWAWAEPPADAAARAEEIGSVLRCPVCQGMPIAESPSDMAQAMMKRVRELVDEGKSRDEIVAYFTERYGEWVLLQPEASGLNLVLWGLPPVALVVGLIVLRLYSRKATDKAKPAASAKGEGRTAPSDPYLDAVRREVDS